MPSYRFFGLLTLGLVITSIVLHLLWMPHVRYNPFAPFIVLKWSIEGTYFPVFGLFAWITGKYTILDKYLKINIEKRDLKTLTVAIFISLLVAFFMDWYSAINLIALTLWLFFSFYTSQNSNDRKTTYIVEWLITATLFASASYVFTIFKAGLFYLYQPNDAAIVLMENIIFGQPDLYVRFAIIGQNLNSTVISLLESIYFQGFAHMLLVSIFLAATGNHIERQRYILSLVLCYLVGAFSYYALPALGPVFYNPDLFKFIKIFAPHTYDIQQLLVYNTSAAQARFTTMTQLDVFGFIASMPSLHLAHETIMIYYSRQSKIALLASGIFFVGTSISVLIFGWHYIIDIPIGILFGFIMIKLTKQLTTDTAHKIKYN